MIYRFDGREVDTARREVRVGGALRPLQPQPFAVLAYLLHHRERAVSKAELLEKLWPDAVVGEGSVQRAVSLARAAIDDDGTRLRTLPRHGYRLLARVEEVAPHDATSAADASPDFRPRFARSGEVHIAYHTLGEGELDIVLVPGWAFPMRAFLGHPDARAVVRGLAEHGRVVLFDKRGTGLSDRVKDLPDLERRMDDLRAVLDAVGSRQALLVGYSEGGPLSLAFATTHPERVRGLVLVGAFARWGAAPDYPHGWTPDVVAHLRSYILDRWGAGATIAAIAESRAAEPDVQAWAARAEQEGASPGAALELLEMNLQIDVRALLPLVTVPTVVLHHRRDSVIHVDNGRYLASRIPGARLVEPDGIDHVFLFQGSQHVGEAVGGVLAREPTAPSERFLATVLVVEAGGVEVPPHVSELVSRHRGLRTGVSWCWSFDGPRRAIACAQALLDAGAGVGREARGGVHAGEVVRAGGRLEGECVAAAARIARAAAPGEVWVSDLVQKLVHGSGLDFDARPPLDLGGGRRIDLARSAPPVRKR